MLGHAGFFTSLRKSTLKGMIVELLVSLQERDRDNEALRHRLDQLLRRLFGRGQLHREPGQRRANICHIQDRRAAASGVCEDC